MSALLDGEPAGVEQSVLEEHLARCPDCRSWRDDAHIVTRHARLAAAEQAPAAGAALLAALAAEQRRPLRRLSPLARTRLALVAVALAQIALTVPQLILGSDHEAPIHIAHEMGSFDLALAIGFLAAAWQPTRARGMHIVIGVAALLLVVTAAIDLIAGRTTIADEAPHLLAVAGWALLYRAAALAPAGVPRLARLGRDFAQPLPALPTGLPPSWEDAQRTGSAGSLRTDADFERQAANG
jgi:predicted anti-sigma-YlaC factor YlaD